MEQLVRLLAGMLVRVGNDYQARFAEAAAFFSIGAVTPSDLVALACDALVGGQDSQALRELAGQTPPTSVYDIEHLLEKLADDLLFTFHRRGSDSGRIAAARVMAARCLAGEMPAQELTRWMHERIGHGHDSPPLEDLVTLDDQYDIAEYTGQDKKEVDSAVVAAARRLLDH